MTAALQWTTFLNMVLIVAPPSYNSTAQIAQVLQQSKAEGAVLAPSQICDISLEPFGLETLRGLGYIYFAGASLPKSIAEKLVGHVKIQPAMGTTECGAYWVDVRNQDDWEYYRFRESNGIEMRQRTDTLYELVFKKQRNLARWQLYFHLNPNVNEFATKDLWTQHPTRPDLWRYGGRADDLVNFTHGESLYTTPLEAIIQEHPNVWTALIGGEGRSRPFVIIEMTGSETKTEKLSSVLPYIERANERCIEVVKLSQDRVIFTDPAKPLPRTVKDTVLRSSALKLYGPEIESVYKIS